MSLTQRLRELEAELGVALFEHAPRGMNLTRAGERREARLRLLLVPRLTGARRRR